MDTSLASGSLGPTQRRYVIAASILLAHVLLLWAASSGLMRKAGELIVPAEMLAQWLPSSSPAPSSAEPPKPLPVIKAARVPVMEPTPVLSSSAAPSVAPVTAEVSAPPASGSPVPIAAEQAPAVQLPSSTADYLDNPKPVYPPQSRRLREQGRVRLHVLIGVDGVAQQVEIAQSSGFDRLDDAARKTARAWRYVPGKRNGVPEAMWFYVPINFVLE
jgi:protein TonB